MQRFLLELWENDVYRAVIVFIFAELLLLTTQWIWLVLREGQRTFREKRLAKFETELGESFFDALMDPDEESKWVKQAGRYSESTIRAYLEPRIRVLAGDTLEAATQIYRRLGLVGRDVKMMRSPMWHRRVLAMRRLVFVAGPEERPVLLATEGDHRAVALMAAQGLARIGSGDDVARVLKNVDVPRRLMEQPVFVLLNSLKPEQFERLLALYDTFRSDSLKKILMIAASRKECQICHELIKNAALSESMEMRLGAAMASANMSDVATEDVLIRLLQDPVPEVRALAARGLGRRKSLAGLGPMADIAADRSFWVRQNVAAAIGALGEVGKDRLERIANEGKDHFASDTARQELERLRVLAARSGGQP